ncbi:MAG: histidinol-phosphate transaminase, partial [Dermatophilaceae bacterium]
MSEIQRLLRPDLRGRTAYGAPQLDVPVCLNTNESSYPVPAVVVRAILEALEGDLAGLNRYPDREFLDLR